MRSVFGSKLPKGIKLLLFIGLPLASFCLTTVLLGVFVPVYRTQTLSRSVSKVQTEVPVAPVRTESPVRLAISSIEVDAVIKPVGVTKQGDMAVDKSTEDVFWYKKGPKPGEKGSAVIAGHYGWVGGQASVFNDVRTLERGDKVSVYDKNGISTSFIVQKIKTYRPKADTAAIFQSSDGKAHLNLITCEGVWSDNLQTYSERLVVFTDKEV